MALLFPATGRAAEPPVAAPASDVPPPTRIRAVTLRGKLLPRDGADRLLRFLDIQVGRLWDDQLQSRVIRDLDVLGYRVDAHISAAGDLEVVVEALRTVRRVFVRGNWPLFEADILSNLSFRSGYRLPTDEVLAAELRKQERDVAAYLHRSGYLDAQSRLSLEWDPRHPDEVDVWVHVDLQAGLWRLRYNVGNIEPRGFTLLTPARVRSFFTHCCLWIGRTSTDRINQDFKQLVDHYLEQGYAGVRLLQRDQRPDPARRVIDLNITIEERRRILLRFTGRKALTERELRDAVTIFRDNYYSANELDESARQIFRLYQSQGFFDAKVNWRWLKRDGDTLVVEFLIEEGLQRKVRDVSFAAFSPGGARPLTFPAARLQDLVNTRRFPRLGLIGLGEGGFTTSVQLDRDARRLEEFYRSRGFKAARVTVEVGRTPEELESASLFGLRTALAGRSAFVEDRGELFVRFLIEEGPREVVASVAIQYAEGAPQVVSTERLQRALLLQPESPYTEEDLQADKLRLLRVFRTVGHPYVTIDPTGSTRDPVPGGGSRVHLRYRLLPGERVRFGPVLIRGNFLTRESVIRKDLPFREGQAFNENLLREAEQNLSQRQLFTFVRVTPNPGETPGYQRDAQEAGWDLRRNPVPVLIEVGERHDNLGEVAVFGGVSTDNVVFGSASYTWRNLFGTGSEAELRGELGVLIQSLFARYSAPRFLAPFWRLDLRGFWRNERTYSLGPVTTYGANTELTRFVARTDSEGRRLPPTVRFFTRLEFAINQLQVNFWQTEATGDPGRATSGDQTQALKLTAGVVWDRRVGFEAPLLRLRGQPEAINPLMPVSGFLLMAQATAALCCNYGPFDPSGSFVTLSGQAIGLLPVGPILSTEDGWPFGMKRFNLKANLRLNYGIPLARPALPVVERFFAGGDTATRGYDTDRLRAEEIRVPLSPTSGEAAYLVVPQGGNISLLSTLEWEFAITPKLLGQPWVGALFLDTGAVFNSWSALRWNDVRFSVGASLLRFLTRFGSLSLEYAYPLVMPGQDALLQSDRWKVGPWYSHFPGRIHFNWGMQILR